MTTVFTVLGMWLTLSVVFVFGFARFVSGANVGARGALRVVPHTSRANLHHAVRDRTRAPSASFNNASDSGPFA